MVYWRRNLPKSWDYQLEGLKEIAKTLSKGFDFVRVDLYCYQKEFYFGEMTFTSFGGYMNFYTQEFLDIMGNEVDLSVDQYYKGA